MCHIGEGMPKHTLDEIEFTLDLLLAEAADEEATESEPESVR